MSELSKNVGVVRAAQNGTKVTVSSSKAELPLHRNPSLAFSFLGVSPLLLKTVASEVPEFLTVKTLYSPHVPSFSLSSNISLSWGEGRCGCLVLVVSFGAVIVTRFSDIGSPSISRGVHC